MLELPQLFGCTKLVQDKGYTISWRSSPYIWRTVDWGFQQLRQTQQKTLCDGPGELALCQHPCWCPVKHCDLQSD